MKKLGSITMVLLLLCGCTSNKPFKDMNEASVQKVNVMLNPPGKEIAGISEEHKIELVNELSKMKVKNTEEMLDKHSGQYIEYTLTSTSNVKTKIGIMCPYVLINNAEYECKNTRVCNDLEQLANKILQEGK